MNTNAPGGGFGRFPQRSAAQGQGGGPGRRRVEGAERVVPVRLLTVAEVAAALQISERAVRRWIAEGRLPAVHLGRAVRIRPVDLAQLIATGLTD